MPKVEKTFVLLGGLFVFANTFVIDEAGQKHPVFDFAEVPKNI